MFRYICIGGYVQIHMYKYIRTDTQVQMHMYRYMCIDICIVQQCFLLWYSRTLYNTILVYYITHFLWICSQDELKASAMRLQHNYNVNHLQFAGFLIHDINLLQRFHILVQCVSTMIQYGSDVISLACQCDPTLLPTSSPVSTGLVHTAIYLVYI